MVVENVDGSELRFKNPGRLLLVVIGFIFWAIGFIDLLGHTSADSDIFGYYSLPLFVFILLYGATIILWLALFFNANLLSRVSDWVGIIQQHTWLALTVCVGLGVILWVIFEWDRWSSFPGLQFAIFGLVILAGLVLLFSNWKDRKNQQIWRKIIAFPLIALVIVEIVIQLLAWFGILPGTYTIGGDYIPYERIYHNAEGYRNDFANRYGWSFPDFKLDDENERILIVGGSFIQALQVQPEEQFGVHLSELINQNSSESQMQTEIVSIGLPGFGLSPFLYDAAAKELPDIIKYDEIIVVFHLSDDFQSPIPSNNSIRYTINESGEVQVYPDDTQLRHDLAHFYLSGYMSLRPVETIRGNYLTPKVINSLFGNTLNTNPSTGEEQVDFTRRKGIVTANYALTEPFHAGIKSTDLETIPYGNNFNFKTDETEAGNQAILITSEMLRTAQEIYQANNILLRVVTIPVYPEAFYDEYSTDNWEPIVGELNLFLPEERLRSVAQELDIPFLGLGEFMRTSGLSKEQVRSLYLIDGTGHFSPAGHAFFADAIYECFYNITADCSVPGP